MTTPTPREASDDPGLRERLREGLAQAPTTGLEALESRALAQWRQRTAAQARSSRGALALLQAGWHQHPALYGGALLALGLAAVLLFKTWSAPDPALDELLQPDLLSFIAAGEL